MTIPFERLFEIFDSTHNSNPDIESLILEYCKLKQVGEDVENRLYQIENQYSMIYWDFNFNSIYTILAEIGLLFDIKNELESQEVLCKIGNMVLKSTLLKISYYNDLIRLKSKTNFLQKLDYYYNHPNVLSELIS
jgi:hypothetical protein